MEGRNDTTAMVLCTSVSSSGAGCTTGQEQGHGHTGSGRTLRLQEMDYSSRSGEFEIARQGRGYPECTACCCDSCGCQVA